VKVNDVVLAYAVRITHGANCLDTPRVHAERGVNETMELAPRCACGLASFTVFRPVETLNEKSA
jgi:hypothetical protein